MVLHSLLFLSLSVLSTALFVLPQPVPPLSPSEDAETAAYFDRLYSKFTYNEYFDYLKDVKTAELQMEFLHQQMLAGADEAVDQFRLMMDVEYGDIAETRVEEEEQKKMQEEFNAFMKPRWERMHGLAGKKQLLLRKPFTVENQEELEEVEKEMKALVEELNKRSTQFAAKMEMKAKKAAERREENQKANNEKWNNESNKRMEKITKINDEMERAHHLAELMVQSFKAEMDAKMKETGEGSEWWRQYVKEKDMKERREMAAREKEFQDIYDKKNAATSEAINEITENFDKLMGF